MSKNEFFIYAEAPPLGENVVTHGLFRASTPILRAVRDSIETIALFPWDRHFRMSMLDPALSALCTGPAPSMAWFRAATKRLGPIGQRLDTRLAIGLIAPKATTSTAQHILCLEGSDPLVLPHVAGIAATARKPFSVYVVDDILLPMRLGGADDKMIMRATEGVRASLSKAHTVFAISDRLGSLFERQFGVKATTLPLIFEPQPLPNETPRKQIIFVGSINFLYADPLRKLIATVEEIRDQTGEELTIRFTSRSAAMLGDLPPFVRVEAISGAENLAREISASLFAFLPYSFDANVVEMIKTSFPSKLMEYLAYARSIVVFAPDYANSTHYFQSSGLPQVAHDGEGLKEEILRHLREVPCYRDHYLRQLSKAHSPVLAREIILSAVRRDA
jgi:hypothetical protein